MATYFITGIGTGVGKTFISAVLTAGLDATYWKPIQAGILPETDFESVRKALNLSENRCIPPAYLLQKAESPHSASEAEGITIKPVRLPEVRGNFIIEGAGGILVPLNTTQLYIDQVKSWQIPVIIVVDGYLGAINHTLLTVEALQNRSIPIHGFIFNRIQNTSARDYIIRYCNIPILGELPESQPKIPEDYKTLFEKYIERDAFKIA